MRWQRKARSRNIEDRRARSGRGMSGRGGGPIRAGLGRVPAPGRRGSGISLTGIIVLLAVSWLTGTNPLTLLGGAMGGPGTQASSGSGATFGSGGSETAGQLRTTPEEEKLVDFVSFVLDDLQETWTKLLPGYRAANLVLFRDATHSGCGTGQSEMGPFYCPRDQKVYIDLSFYGDLNRRFGAPGDFAQAYVLAHEIGHHLQTITGISGKIARKKQASPHLANKLSVLQELQADCLAGVWGHEAAKRGILEPGDAEEGLRAAAAIGDDRIQEMSGRAVQHESFTHGSSEQRVRWLRRGLDSGNPEICDTFSHASL